MQNQPNPDPNQNQGGNQPKANQPDQIVGIKRPANVAGVGNPNDPLAAQKKAKLASDKAQRKLVLTKNK